MDNIEFKNVRFEDYEIKESSDSKTVEISGYAAVFGNEDSHGDVVVKGAFTDWIVKTDFQVVPILLDHNTSIKTTAGYNVKAAEDEKGLFVVGELNLETEAGKTAYSVAKHAKRVGKPIGLSIGYITEEREFREDLRFLTKITLKEYSFLNFPSNELAGVVSVKSIIKNNDKEQIAEKKKFIERTLRDAGLSKSEATKTVSFIFSIESKEAVVEEVAESVVITEAETEEESVVITDEQSTDEAEELAETEKQKEEEEKEKQEEEILEMLKALIKKI